MRIFLQQPTGPVPGAPLRFYEIELARDLFGGFVLTRQWGESGGRSGSKRDVFLNRDDAQAALDRAREAQLKRGFRVMFARGEAADNPHPTE